MGAVGAVGIMGVIGVGSVASPMSPHKQTGYAIRLSANAVLQREIARLLVRRAEWPSRKPIVCYHDFTYQAQSWSVPGEWQPRWNGIKGSSFPGLVSW